MHNPFIALAELCVLGRQDYFCLKENVVDGDRASATSAKWLSRASFRRGRPITMMGDNVHDGLEAEERVGAGMEAPSRFSSRSCSSINLMVWVIITI